MFTTKFCWPELQTAMASNQYHKPKKRYTILCRCYDLFCFIDIAIHKMKGIEIFTLLYM